MPKHSAGFQLPDLLRGVTKIGLQNFLVVLTEKRCFKVQHLREFGKPEGKAGYLEFTCDAIRDGPDGLPFT